MKAYLFRDRIEAGRLLARALMPSYGERPDVLVLGLPRGGVPVAAEVARALAAPLDVWPVRKVGVSGHEELAMGAIASGGGAYLNAEVLRQFRIRPETVHRAVDDRRRELERREHAFYAGRAPPTVTGRTVIVVDDGLATGATMRAALIALRRQAPARLVAAVPVAAAETCAAIERDGLADEVVCPMMPTPFFAVGEYYADFRQVSDDDVLRQLAGARYSPAERTPAI